MRQTSCFRSMFACLALACALALTVCQDRSSTAPSGASKITVTAKTGGPVTITTPSAEFKVLPSGYVQAYLLKQGKSLTLDDPDSVGAEPANSVTVAGKEVTGFALDFNHVRISEARGKIGGPGKRIEITGRSQDKSAAIEESLVFEAYDDFPRLLIA